MNTNKRVKIRQRAAVRNTLQEKKRSNEAEDHGWPSQAAFALALIVILLMLNFILRFPDLGAIIAEYNQF
jgi:hypothetical protein